MSTPQNGSGTDDAQRCAQRGHAQLEHGDYAAAARSFARQIELDARNAVAHYDLGRSLYFCGERENALQSFRRAVQIDPRLTPAHYNIGFVSQELGRNAEAEAAYRAALAIDPAYFDALTNLVVVLRRQPEKLQHALQAGLLAVRAAAHDADNWNNLGLVSHDLGDLPSAQACIEKALSIDDGKAEYFMNLGSVMLDARRVDEAIACFERAVARQADYAEAHMNLGLALLLAGRFERGWDEYAWRIRVRDNARYYPQTGQPPWRGGDAAGRRILIVGEQGLGDTLHFVRYASSLEALGATPIIVCQAPLKRLLAASLPDLNVVAQDEATPPYADWIPMMSLPGLLAPRPEQAPRPPYLRAAVNDVRRFADLLGPRPRPRIGLVWSGDPRPHDIKANRVDRRRSMHFAQMSPLLEVAGIDFFSVQKGRPAEQLREVGKASALTDLTAQLGDFSDTAALIANLDLLVTVDTSVAHLAGALGVPVWLLSRFDGCWRWRLAGETTPWYPSMTIYRQPAPGDWAGVIARVSDDLASFAAAQR